MYGKVFTSIYDGSLYGHWEAIVTMQQLIVLADEDGIVDVTPEAIAGKTSIPLEIIQKGLEILSAPDPATRTPGNDGVRISLIDKTRSWGWILVNYEHYKKIRNAEDRRKYMRSYMREKREKEKDVNSGKQELAGLANINTSLSTVTSTLKSKKSRFVPKDFEVTNKMMEWAINELNLYKGEIESETEKFRDHEFKDPKSDFNRTWRKWLRNYKDNYRSSETVSGYEAAGRAREL